MIILTKTPPPFTNIRTIRIFVDFQLVKIYRYDKNATACFFQYPM